MSTLKVSEILDTAGGNTVTINGATPTVDNTMGKNRIINGDCRIDQRNAGASVNNGASGYTLDRWVAEGSSTSKFTIQQVSSTLAGFPYALKVTSSAATSVGSTDVYDISTRIEGYNFGDLGFGTANYKTITLSFWVQSSLTGTFGGSLESGAATYYSYPFTYTISAANTWEYKTVTIEGTSNGTWNTSNGRAAILNFGLGCGSSQSGTAGAWVAGDLQSATGAVSVVGTNGATWYITGVQLEVGSVASEFERRPFQQELALAQRYFEKSYSQNTAIGTATESNVEWVGTSFSTLASTAAMQAQLRPFKVVKRAAPTMTFWDFAGTEGKWTRYLVGSGPSNNNTVTVDTQDDCGFRMFVAAGSNTSNCCGHWAASSEL